MRYLGNKTKLLKQIEATSRKVGFSGGTVCDLFAGTGVVGRHFRSIGCRVVSTDLMACSYVFQKVYLEIERYPAYEKLRAELKLNPGTAPRARLHPQSTLAGDPQPTLAVIEYLEHVIEPVEGLLSRQYSPDGSPQRQYLMPRNARRLDAILMALREWRSRQLIDEAEEMLMVAAAIDAADRVANISGTYGAYLKSWQQNSKQDVALRLPLLMAGPRGVANHCNAADWIGEVEADLLYVDPPYNQRQYPSNYNFLDVVARIPREPDLDLLESEVYGKTGQIPWKSRASQLCSKRGTECRDAFRALLQNTRIPRVVISYSEEGIMSRRDFEEILAEYAGVARSALGNVLTEISYPRFRSDADGRVSSIGTGRNYRVVPGRKTDEVHEWLFHIERQKIPS